MAEYVASSSNSFEKEKEFYVRDIPESLKDWDLFRIFRCYGLVNCVRIPLNQNATGKKYGFVAMVGLDSADNVRKALTNGRLVIDDNVSLMINDTRNGIEKDSKPPKQAGVGTKNRPYTPQHTSPVSGPPLNRNKTYELKKKPSYVMPKLLAPDLPLNHTLKVVMVPSPFPPIAGEGFVFHVYRLDCAIAKEYDVLQKNMNSYCEQNKSIDLLSDAPEIKVGDPLIYGRDNVAYRGFRTGVQEIYLMDVDSDERVEFSENCVWLMQREFCKLPTLIASCLLANVEWCEGAADNFERYRDVLINWSNKENGISITIKGYEKSHSVVDVFGSAGCLVDSLVRQGMANKITTEGRLYEREELVSLKNMGKCLPECVNKNGAIEQILICQAAAMSV